MSSLIVAHDLHIMMLEFVVNSVYVPWKTVFDRVILKKTTVMFRMLDGDWTTLFPQRPDSSAYRGSNRELELFHGGCSVIFSLPESTLEENVNGVDLQVYVYKEICKHFEMDSCQNVGFLLVRVDDLFNGIIKELRERKELADYLSTRYHREPVSRSLKGKYPLMNEAMGFSEASIDLYVRLSYLGKCVITEIDLTDFECKAFHAREERCRGNPYECHEITDEDVRAGRSFKTAPIRPPPDARRRLLTCQCDQLDDRPETIQRMREMPREHGYEVSKDEDREERQDDVEDVTEEVDRGKKKGKEKKENGEEKQSKGKKEKREEKQSKEKKENREEKQSKEKKENREEKLSKEKKENAEEKLSKDRKKGDQEGSRVKDTKKGNGETQEYKGMKKVNMEIKDDKKGQGRETNMDKTSKKVYKPGQKVVEQEANKNSTKKKNSRPDAELQGLLALIMSNRRRRGNVTVGIQDKKKKICPPQAPKLPTCQPCQPCYYPVDCYRPVCPI